MSRRLAVGMLVLYGTVSAHPEGHDGLDEQEFYRHAIELRLAGSDAGEAMLAASAARGFRPAQFDRYLNAVARADPLARRWLWRASGPSDPNQQFQLGQRYLIGDGLVADAETAAFWFREAAGRGHAAAQVMLSGLLERADGIEGDDDQALFWLMQAARGGSSEARFRLGRRLGGEAGRGWIERAARAGHAPAQRYLGVQLSRGGDYEEDAETALHWLAAAAEGGDLASMLLVGLMYLEGRGTAPDPVTAYRWLKRAQLAGDHRGDPQVTELEKRLSLEDRLLVMTDVMDAAIPDPVPLERFANQIPANQLLGHGSGFWIHGDGYLVTNHHVVDQCSEVRVPGYGPLQPVASEIQNDVAILRGERNVDSWFGMASDGSAAVGATVTALTVVHPNTDYEVVQRHSGTIRALQRPGSDPRFLRFDARLDEGSSGAPLLNEAGEVVGLVVAKLTAPAAYRLTGEAGQAASFALRSEILRAYLELYGIESGAGQGTAANRIARVECWF